MLKLLEGCRDLSRWGAVMQEELCARLQEELDSVVRLRERLEAARHDVDAAIIANGTCLDALQNEERPAGRSTRECTVV